MDSFEPLLSFAKITFPVLLLIPALITSFRRFAVPPTELAIVFTMLLLDYCLIVVGALWSAINRTAYLSLVLLIISLVPVSFALYYVIKWSLHEQIGFWVDSRVSTTQDL